MQTNPPFADSRPRLVCDAGEMYLTGRRCANCGYPLAFARPRCPICHGPLLQNRFGPCGTVWASTIVRIAIAEHVPPYGLAYVDLDNGPRILAHTSINRTPLPVGTRVRLISQNERDDLLVQEVV